MGGRKLISIVTPCYNEEDNINDVVSAVRESMKNCNYDYEHILIDNHSKDLTWDKIVSISKLDSHVKGIRNVRNFGPARSASYGMFQATGDAVIELAADLQDPPELIPSFIEKWEEGYKVVLGQKKQAEENKIMFEIRCLYYKTISHFAETKQFNQTTGWGLYDREVLDILKSLNEPDPSFRHLVAELGYEVAFIQYTQPKRLRGKSSYNIKRYFDYAINTLITTSQAPLKLAIIWGLIISFVSFFLGIFFLVWKLVDWMRFDAGQAPLLIGLFFMGGVLLMFIGIIGEYIGEILKRSRHFPLVIEQTRIGFTDEADKKI